MLRSAVGQQTGIKFTPTLAFKLDTVPENAYRINELIAAARSADAEVARAGGRRQATRARPIRTVRPRGAADDDDVDDAADDAATSRRSRRYDDTIQRRHGPGHPDGRIDRDAVT